jgi:hypothetical protein
MKTDPESRWFTIYVHTCDADPRSSGDRLGKGKQYVGQVVHLLGDASDTPELAMKRRWRAKRYERSLIGHTVRQFGTKNFRHEILDTVLGQTAANLAEAEWAEKLDTYEPHGYNRRKCGTQGALTFEERSAFGRIARRKGMETLGPEGRSAAMYKAKETLGPEGRKAISRKAMETLGPEGRSAAAQKAKETLGPEGRKSATRKANETKGPEGRSAAVRKALKTMGPKGRHARALKSNMTSGPDGRSARVRRANATRGPEGRRASALKGIETQGPEGLKQRLYKAWDVRWFKALRLALAQKDFVRAIGVLKACLYATMRRLAEDPLFGEQIVE